MTEPTSRIYLDGIAATNAGSILLVDSGYAAEFGTNDPMDMIISDLGWLVKTRDIESVDSGITVNFEYNSLTNSSLSDLDPILLELIDSIVSSNIYSQSGDFYLLNSLGRESALSSVRFSETQLPETIDAAFQAQHQLANQIASRSTEYRSMNGFASTKPSFGTTATPLGVAGPDSGGDTIEGWIRAYHADGNREADENFSEYDLSTFGLIVGVDKSFGNLLFGLAGGYARSSLDGGVNYDAKVNTYHGTVYSTIGGKSVFIDLALTAGAIITEEKSATIKDYNFNSSIVSGYIGGGKRFDVANTVSITPEVSLLTSYYTEESRTRGGVVENKMLPEYDTWSYLSSVGITLAGLRQIEWLAQNFAFVPEVRTHLLHEFNTDLDNRSYTVPGESGTFPLYMRPRIEDMFKVGVGMDVWNWKHQKTKFELDYDFLYAEDYMDHVFSGKITYQF